MSATDRRMWRKRGFSPSVAEKTRIARDITEQRRQQEALAKAEAERMAKEALYRQTPDQSFEAIPIILENRLIQDLKQTHIQLEAEYLKLSGKFKPDYPEMKRLKNQMDSVYRQLQKEIHKIAAEEAEEDKRRCLKKSGEAQLHRRTR